MTAMSFSCKPKIVAQIISQHLRLEILIYHSIFLEQAELKIVTGVRKNKIIFIGQAYHYYC